MAKDNSDTARAEKLNKEMADKVRENDQAARNRGGRR